MGKRSVLLVTIDDREEVRVPLQGTRAYIGGANTCDVHLDHEGVLPRNAWVEVRSGKAVFARRFSLDGDYFVEAESRDGAYQIGPARLSLRVIEETRSPRDVLKDALCPDMLDEEPGRISLVNAKPVKPDGEELTVSFFVLLFGLLPWAVYTSWVWQHDSRTLGLVFLAGGVGTLLFVIGRIWKLTQKRKHLASFELRSVTTQGYRGGRDVDLVPHIADKAITGALCIHRDASNRLIARVDGKDTYIDGSSRVGMDAWHSVSRAELMRALGSIWSIPVHENPLPLVPSRHSISNAVMPSMIGAAALAMYSPWAMPLALLPAFMMHVWHMSRPRAAPCEHSKS